MGEYSQAEQLYKQILTTREKEKDIDPRALALSVNNLAAVYESMGRLMEAEPLYKRAVRDLNCTSYFLCY